MTLDHVLNTALQARGIKAVLLLNEFHVPIAGEVFVLINLLAIAYLTSRLGRGDLLETEIQAISHLLCWTDVDSTGRISFSDG